MNGARILISPLSWGFGHAGRMIPLAMALRQRGCEVIFATDARLAEMIERELPGISTVKISGLTIRYSRLLPQYISIFLHLPVIIASALKEHRELRRLVEELRPSVIISDNRFGFYNKKIFSVYVTHQVTIAFPALLRFLEPLAAWLHRIIIRRYDLCLVPDYPGNANLSGRLSHGKRVPDNVVWIGPLSRFAVAGSDLAMVQPWSVASSGRDQAVADQANFGTPGSDCAAAKPVCLLPAKPYACLILSGPEPQCSLLLRKTAESVHQLPLIVLTATQVSVPLSGVSAPVSSVSVPHSAVSAPVSSGSVPYSGVSAPLSSGSVPHSGVSAPVSPVSGLEIITAPSAATMRRVISEASLVITRAGYTSVMELVSLQRGAVLIPTPGQTEQEYLGRHLDGRFGFIVMRQKSLGELEALVDEIVSHSTREEPAGENTTPGKKPEEKITSPWEEPAGDIPSPARSAGDQGRIPVHEPLPDHAPLFEKALQILSEQKPE